MGRPSRLLGKAALAGAAVVAAGAAQATAATPVADAPKVIETATHRFGLSSADGRNTIQLTARPVDLAVL
jgi:hypothetical protein